MALKPASAIDLPLLGRARHHLDDCHLCPHDCGVERAESAGFCRVGGTSFIASEMLHMGEEALLRPAHAIFLSGCTARALPDIKPIRLTHTWRVLIRRTVAQRQLSSRVIAFQRNGPNGKPTSE